MSEKPDGGQTILIIDDEDKVREATARMLEHYGHEVLEAADGEQGLTLFMLSRQRIDLVLLDLLMPFKSGQMVLEDIKAIDPEAKVLIYTGYEAREETTYPGAIGLLKKPVGMTELARAVQEALDT